MKLIKEQYREKISFKVTNMGFKQTIYAKSMNANKIFDDVFTSAVEKIHICPNDLQWILSIWKTILIVLRTKILKK